MKPLVLLVLTLWMHAACGQQATPLPLDPKTHRITYAADVPLVGVGQAEMLARAADWTSQREHWGQPLSSPPDTRQVLVNGCTPLTYRLAGKPITISLRFVGRLSPAIDHYYYELTDFVFEYPAATMPAERLFTNTVSTGSAKSAQYLQVLRTSFDQTLAALVTQLRATMRTPRVGPSPLK
jgi:hypothetical protein